nr:hypothetical protein [Microcella alkaliphila]
MTRVHETAPATDADGRWRRPPPALSELRPDALLALTVAVGGAVTVLLYASVGFFDEPPVPWHAAVMIIGFSGPLVFRRLAPITVTVVVSAVYIIGVTNKVPEVLFSNIALFAAMYSIGAWSTSRRAALISRTLIVVGMFGWLFYGLASAAFDTSLAPEDSGIGLIAPGVAAGLIAVITNILYFAGAWAFGDPPGTPPANAPNSRPAPASSPPSANAPPRKPSRSTACASAASCTTSSPTTCQSWASRPAPPAAPSKPAEPTGPTQRSTRSAQSSSRPGKPSTNCTGWSRLCATPRR